MRAIIAIDDFSHMLVFCGNSTNILLGYGFDQILQTYLPWNRYWIHMVSLEIYSRVQHRQITLIVKLDQEPGCIKDIWIFFTIGSRFAYNGILGRRVLKQMNIVISIHEIFNLILTCAWDYCIKCDWGRVMMLPWYSNRASPTIFLQLCLLLALII